MSDDIAAGILFCTSMCLWGVIFYIYYKLWKQCEKMKQNRVKEVQEYLAEKGIKASEVAIVNAAIDIARRLGAGDYTFVCEFEEKEKC